MRMMQPAGKFADGVVAHSEWSSILVLFAQAVQGLFVKTVVWKQKLQAQKEILLQHGFAQYVAKSGNFKQHICIHKNVYF